MPHLTVWLNDHQRTFTRAENPAVFWAPAVGAPLVVTFVGAFFGMFLPITAQNSHSVVWESLYGIGFCLAGFLPHGHVANALLGLVGLVVWPLLACGIVFLLTGVVMRSSSRVRIVVGILFGASLFASVSHDAENYLSSRGAPLYWNLYATYY